MANIGKATTLCAFSFPLYLLLQVCTYMPLYFFCFTHTCLSHSNLHHYFCFYFFLVFCNFWEKPFCGKGGVFTVAATSSVCQILDFSTLLSFLFVRFLNCPFYFLSSVICPRCSFSRLFLSILFLDVPVMLQVSKMGISFERNR